MALFADLVNDLCTPPKCGADGGLKCHCIPLFAIDSLIFSWSNYSISDFSSLSAALKFVPLSEYISSIRPLRLAILYITFKNESVLKLYAISK